MLRPRAVLAVAAGAAMASLLLGGCSGRVDEAVVPAAAAAPASSQVDAAVEVPSTAVPSDESIVPGYSAAAIGPADTVAAAGLPTIHFRIKTSKPVFFITVDDGTVKQKAALDYVRSRRLPVTTFLTNAAVGGNYAYFKAFSAYDAVQNHTMTHKALSKASTNREFEICRTQQIYAAKFGTRPWILRPPYGAGMYPYNSATQRNRILTTAKSCGIKHIAMWDVTVSASGQVAYASSTKRLRPGDIVLLHFEGNVAANLKRVVALGRAAGLTPAPLSKVLSR